MDAKKGWCCWVTSAAILQMFFNLPPRHRSAFGSVHFKSTVVNRLTTKQSESKRKCVLIATCNKKRYTETCNTDCPMHFDELRETPCSPTIKDTALTEKLDCDMEATCPVPCRRERLLSLYTNIPRESDTSRLLTITPSKNDGFYHNFERDNSDDNLFSEFKTSSDTIRRCSASVERSDGLVLCHISHREFKINVFAGMVKIAAAQGKQVGGGKRGVVDGFTRAARKRMIERLSKTRNTQKGAFVTLTYPALYPCDAATWKRHLDTFLKRLKRFAPNCHAIWRIEPQQRGAPHYHLIVFNHPSRLSSFRRWVKLAWYAVVGSGDERHRAAGTRVDAIYNRRHAIAYASKYAAKPSEGGRNFITSDGEVIDHVGKHWGVFNAAAADCEAFGCFSLSPLEVVELRRMMARFLKSKGSRYAKRVARGSAALGWSVFGLGDDAQENSTRRTIMRMLIAASL